MNGLWSLVLGLQDTAWHQACLATACCSCMQRCLPGLEMVPRQSCEWSFNSKVSGLGLGLGSWFKFQNDWSKSVPETVPERKPEPETTSFGTPFFKPSLSNDLPCFSYCKIYVQIQRLTGYHSSKGLVVLCINYSQARMGGGKKMWMRFHVYPTSQKVFFV